MLHIENTYPAGVINVGFSSEICAVLIPPMTATVAKLLTIMVATKAKTLDICKATKDLDDFIKTNKYSNTFMLISFTKFSFAQKMLWFFLKQFLGLASEEK